MTTTRQDPQNHPTPGVSPNWPPHSPLPSCSSLSCLIAYELAFELLVSSALWRQELAFQVQNMNYTVRDASHLVHSRNPVWIAQGSSHCSLPTFHLASWVLCGLTEVSSAWYKSPDVRGCLGSHNRTRHNSDQKGLALGPSWGAFLFPLFCTVWSAGH